MNFSGSSLSVLKPQNVPARNIDAVSAAVMKRYGDTASMMSLFCPKRQQQLALNVEKYMRSGAPSFPAMVKAYGKPNMAILLCEHITDVLIFRGEQDALDEVDVNNVALGLCEIARTSLLSMASAIGFFYRFKLGEFKMWGRITPAKIFEAFQQYATEAREKEIVVYDKIQKEQERADRDITPDPDSFARMCRNHGLPPLASATELFAYFSRRHEASKALINFIVALRQLLVTIKTATDTCPTSPDISCAPSSSTSSA